MQKAETVTRPPNSGGGFNYEAFVWMGMGMGTRRNNTP